MDDDELELVDESGRVIPIAYLSIVDETTEDGRMVERVRATSDRPFGAPPRGLLAIRKKSDGTILGRFKMTSDRSQSLAGQGVLVTIRGELVEFNIERR